MAWWNNTWTTAALIVAGIGSLIALGFLMDPEGEKRKAKPEQKAKGKKPVAAKARQTIQAEQFEDEDDELGLEKLSEDFVPPHKPNKPFDLQKLMEDAEMAKRNGDFAKAKQYYAFAIRVLQSAPDVGKDHIYTGLTTYALGLVHKQSGSLEDGIKCMKKAIEIVEKYMESSNADPLDQFQDQYADILATLSATYVQLQQYDLADEYLDQAIKVIENRDVAIKEAKRFSTVEKKKLMEKTAQEKAILYDNLCELRFKQQNLEDAEEVGQRALELLTDAFGKKDPTTQHCMQRLGQILMERNKPKEANEIFEEVINEFQEKGIQRNPNLLLLLNWAATLNFNQEQWDYAEQWYKRLQSVVEAQQEDVKEKTSSVLEVSNDLVVLYQQCGKDQQGEDLMHEMLSKMKELDLTPPVTHSKYLSTMDAQIKMDKEKPHYFVQVKVREKKKKHKELNAGAILEFAFEDPSGGEDLIVDYEYQGEKVRNVEVVSPPLSSVEKEYYIIQCHIYKDKSKTKKLSSHHIFCKSNVTY